MSEEKTQINFQTSAEDAVAIDRLAALDGFDSRSAWVRFHLRRVINARRAELATVTALPRPAGAQVVPVVSLSGDSVASA